MRTRVERLAFNRGLISRLGLARADIKRVALAAETHTNWMPRVLGSMSMRPGWQFLDNSRNDAQAFHIPFIFSISQKALVELTNLAMRIAISDVFVTRPTVTTTIANDTFDTDLTSWTDADESGATSAWQTGGYLGLTGNGTNFAIRRQQVTVAADSQNIEHGLHIVIERGPVVLRVGTTSGNDDLIAETELGTGTHSLALTPAGSSFWVEFKSRLERIVLVNACEVEAAGDMVVETPWITADLRLIRFGVSADIIYVACGKTTDSIGYQQRKIERRATRSWSVVLYQSEDGPFRTLNVTPTTIAGSALFGNITLTASKPLFRSGHVSALFQMTSVGQTVSASVTAENTFTNTIRVTGTGTARSFTVSRTGTWVATVTLQRSFDEGTSWIDVTTYTTNGTVAFDDGLSNQDVLYRIGVKTGDFTSGTVELTLSITTGSITGVVRVTVFTSSTSVSAEVITDLGGTAATEDWAEGRWSDYRGWPTSVGFHEGRLGWSGRDAITLSISDGFESFDPDFEGDAGPIDRTIGSGPVDTINWLLSLQRLIMGAQLSEFSARASSLDEILTPTNFLLKAAGTQGSAPVQALQIDQNGVFVQRGATRVYDLAFGQDGVDYQTSHLSALVPDIGQPGIVRLALQRQPDTRLHCVRSDGTVAMLVYDKLEEVLCWLEIETDGDVEDAVVLPGDSGDEEDFVYYSVNRTINGATKRYLEKWAFESDCQGGTVNRQADSFLAYNQLASSTISGLSHLEGKSVVVWDNGKCLRTAADEIATFTVTGGAITVTNAGVAYNATQGVVGLQYTASWESGKFVQLLAQLGGSLTDSQLIKGLALVLADVHHLGLKYGQSLTESEMDDLPQMEAGAAVAVDTVHTDYVTEPLGFPGSWSIDARLALLGKAPRPATVIAALVEVEHHG